MYSRGVCPASTLPTATRSLAPPDLAAVERIMLANRPTFSDEEVRLAFEVAAESLSPRPGDREPYIGLVIEAAGAVAGFACYGIVPGTGTTYDLYWIAVSPALQGSGVGTRLIGAVERDIAARGGGRFLAETSTRAHYDGTRAFYLRRGYALLSTTPDHYAPGEHKVVYEKRLD
jgi:ribosomal protein S18 acetylase RimI-like enzyme